VCPRCRSTRVRASTERSSSRGPDGRRPRRVEPAHFKASKPLCFRIMVSVVHYTLHWAGNQSASAGTVSITNRRRSSSTTVGEELTRRSRKVIVATRGPPACCDVCRQRVQPSRDPEPPTGGMRLESTTSNTRLALGNTPP
jgi:hypothetical protein